MTAYLSYKLRNLSALLILMVIYIHMYYSEGESMYTLTTIEGIIGGGICRVAVPLFYIISGYLFFLSVPDGMKSIGQKLKKRCRTLLVPYILANIFTFVFYLILNILALEIKAVDNVMNFKVLNMIRGGNPWDTFWMVFNPPIAFQLWFVRDLMIAMLVSPLIWMIHRWIKDNAIFPLVLIVLFAICTISQITAFCFFYLGGWIAISGKQIDTRCQSSKMAASIFIIYILMSVFYGLGHLPDNIARCIPLIGIPALWMTYDMIRIPENSNLTKLLTGYTFFIYLIHEPLLNIFKKIPLLVNQGEIMLTVCYLTIPIVFYVTASWFGKWMKGIIPRLYSVYTGGR